MFIKKDLRNLSFCNFKSKVQILRLQKLFYDIISIGKINILYIQENNRIPIAPHIFPMPGLVPGKLPDPLPNYANVHFRQTPLPRLMTSFTILKIIELPKKCNGESFVDKPFDTKQEM